MIEAKWPNDYRVMQTFDELGELVYETVLDELLDDDLSAPPVAHVRAWAEDIAKTVKQRFLNQLDGE